MSELRDRFERLAARERAAAPTKCCATRSVTCPMTPVRRRARVPTAPISRSSTTTSSRSSRASPTVTGGAGSARSSPRCGAAALVGVGALAVTALFGSGGAGSPEGAVRQLADAVAHKDPLAAVDVLVPTEVRSMRQTVKRRDARARPT